MLRSLRLSLLLCALAIPALHAQDVWVNFDPGGGYASTQQITVDITFCSNESQIVSGPQIYLNGNYVSNDFSFVGWAFGCTYGQTYRGTISLTSGIWNQLQAYTWDYFDNWIVGYTSFYYEDQPPPPQSGPHYVAYADKFRDPARCVANCFATSVSYSTPAYVSLDATRSYSIMYRSDRARPIVTVAFDANDPNPSNVVAYSLRLRRPDNSYVTFAGGRDEVYFARASSGATRLAAQVDGISLATGAYAYTAVITTHYYSGSPIEMTLPARVMIVNSANSAYGAGWELAIDQKATIQSDGVMIASGDGSISFFDGCSGACQLTSPPGDFSKLTRDGSGNYQRTLPDGTVFYFDGAGNMSGSWGRFGTGFNIMRNWLGLPIIIGDPIAQSTVFVWDGNYKLQSIVTPGLGTQRSSNFVVNGSGDLVEVRDPDNVVFLSAGYNASHQLTTVTDRRGGQWSYTYARDHNLDSLKAPTITAEGSSQRPTTVQSGPMRVLLLQVADGWGSPSTHIYGSFDHRAATQTPRGHATYFTLNRWGSPTQTDFPVGPSATTQYNGNGQVTQTVSQGGHTVNYTWNGVQLTQVADLTTGQTVNTTYENTYNRPLVITGNTFQQTYTYPDNKTVTVKKGTHPATTIKFDQFGRDSVVGDPGGHQTLRYFSNSGMRNTDSTKAAGRVTRYRYDVFGRTVATVAPTGHRDSSAYDILNRIVAAINGMDHVVSYAYGDGVNRTGVTDPNGQTTTFSYNAMGWVEQEWRAGSSSALTTAYDRAGNIIATTNRRGQTVNMSYDALNRITSRSGAGISTATFAYQFASPSSEGYVYASNAEATDTLVYNAADRLVRVTTLRGPNWYRLAYTYSAEGLRIHLDATSNTWSGTKQQSWSYSGTHALTSFVAFGTTTNLNPGPANEDQATQVSYASGLTEGRTFGALHTSQSSSYNYYGVNLDFGKAIAFDDLARVRSNTRNDNTSSEFQYDAAQRLSRYERWNTGGLTCNGGTEIIDENGNPNCTYTNPTLLSAVDYTYDAAGNRLNGVTQLDIPGNRVRAANGYAFNYDADGNLASKVGPGLTQTFGFNPLGELTSVATNGVTTEFGYDALGRRIRKTVAGATTGYLRDGENLHMELDGGGTPVIEYAFWGIDNPLAMYRNGNIYFYMQDAMGHSANGLVAANSTQAFYMYTPWGEEAVVSDPVGMTLRHGGREWDASTGLYYNRARYYDPMIGRFISEDPIGVQGGINLYVYADNDPVNGSDPMGLLRWRLFGIKWKNPWGDIKRIAAPIAAGAVIWATGGLGAAGSALWGAALGSAAAAGVETVAAAAFGNGCICMRTFGGAFMRNFSNASWGLAAGGLAAQFLGGGVASAGRNGIQGYVQANKQLNLPFLPVQGGAITAGPMSLFTTALSAQAEGYAISLAKHELGHTLQFIGLSAIGRNPWAVYFGLGALGIAGGPVEDLASYLGGLWP